MEGTDGSSLAGAGLAGAAGVAGLTVASSFFGSSARTSGAAQEKPIAIINAVRTSFMNAPWNE
jgi:hypothetical protein